MVFGADLVVELGLVYARLLTTMRLNYFELLGLLWVFNLKFRGLCFFDGVGYLLLRNDALDLLQFLSLLNGGLKDLKERRLRYFTTGLV